jgi:hypothetical protein
MKSKNKTQNKSQIQNSEVKDQKTIERILEGDCYE